MRLHIGSNEDFGIVSIPFKAMLTLKSHVRYHIRSTISSIIIKFRSQVQIKSVQVRWDKSHYFTTDQT